MQRLLNLIRPHAGSDRTTDEFPLFNQDFELYEDCLQYKSAQLRELISHDVTFWRALNQKARRLEKEQKVKDNTTLCSLETGKSEDICIKNQGEQYAPSPTQASPRHILHHKSREAHSATLRFTGFLGADSRRGASIDFQWPQSKDDLKVFAPSSCCLSQLNLKTSTSGMYLSGIGLGYTN